MRVNLYFVWGTLLLAGLTNGAVAVEPEKAEVKTGVKAGLGLLWECLPNWSPREGSKIGDEGAPLLPAIPLRVRVSREFLARCVGEPIVRESAIEDEILGTTITGPAKTIARVDILLVPNDERGVAEVTFQGRIESKTKGVHGPVVLYNDAQTEFKIRKRLVVDAGGLRFEPILAVADTDSQTTNIDSRMTGLRGQVARRVAAQRVATRREEADLIAAAHTLAKLDVELTAQLNQLLAGERSGEIARLLNFCQSSPDREARFRSTADYLEITLHRRDAQPGANHLAVPAIDGEPSIAARVHRDMLRSAMLDPQLRGMLMPLLSGGMSGAIPAFAGSAADTLRIEWSPDRQWLLVETERPCDTR